MISGPRNISTALMYSFAQRPDTIVLDEPFYAFYLAKTHVDHPGKEAVLNSQPQHEKEVLHEIFKPWSKPVLFIKNMSHHIELLQEKLLADVTNVFLIRNPAQIIASYARVIANPVMRDIGIEYQYHLFEQLRRLGQSPVVVDSGRLLENPASVLEQLCNALRIPYTPEMLSWEAGPKPYDGVWAPYWYENVHRSTGFEKQPAHASQPPRHLTELHEKADYYYQKLLPFSFTP